MLAALTALLGVIVGTILSGVGLENYKRHKDRQGTASAIAGEIFGILQMSDRRQYVALFTAFLAELDAGRDVAIPPIIHADQDLDPVVKAYMQHVGLLGGDLPERVVTFYQQVAGVRIDMVRLSNGTFGTDMAPKAHIIREDLALWNETVALGNAIRDDLHAIVQEPWWFERSCKWVKSSVAGLVARLRSWWGNE
jgi:hypothetical protein